MLPSVSAVGAPCAPAPAPESRAEQHAALARVASAQTARSSKLANGVSLHTMPQSVSFANLRALLTVAQSQGNSQRIFVGSRDGSIVVSVNHNFEPPLADARKASSKKRTRDPIEEAVQQAVQRVKRGLKGDESVTEGMLETALQALHALLTKLRGASGEDVVESWGLSLKKGETLATSQRPRLIISARLTPGVAVPLGALFSSLGIRCTADGMLTTQDSSSLATGFNLPLSEQGRTAEQHGQRAVTLFATVGST